MNHHLKIWPQFFDPVNDGSKSFEYRKNDRNYRLGDELILREYDPTYDKYSGRQVRVRVTYVLRIKPHLDDGEYAVLAIKKIDETPVAAPVPDPRIDKILSNARWAQALGWMIILLLLVAL